MLDEILRNLHTLKSVFASFSKAAQAELCHTLESELLARKRGGNGPDKPEIFGAIDQLEQSFASFLTTYQDSLGLRQDTAGGTLEVAGASAREFAERLKHTPGLPPELLNDFNHTFLMDGVRDYFRPYNEVNQLVASRRAKEVAPLQIEPENFRLLTQNYARLFGALIHAFRNAVDHGIEAPEEEYQRRERDRWPSRNEIQRS